MRYIETLVSERDQLASQVLGLAETAANENRSLTDSENTSIKNWRDKVESLDGEIRSWNSTGEAFAKFAQLSAPGAQKRAAENNVRETRSAGEIFTESRAFADWSGHGTSGSIEANWLETRAAILTTTNIGDDHQPLEVPGYRAPTNVGLWNVIPKINVTDGSITYPVYNLGSDAAIVAEGAAKPEMTWTMSMVDKTIPTVAHWVMYSRQFAADKAAVRSIIDSELSNGVLRKLNSEAAAALNGVTTTPVTGPDLLSAIRNAQASIEALDGTPDLLLINPADSAAIDLAALAATTNGAAYGAPVWGLRIVKSPKITAARPLVADSSAVTAYVRAGVQVYVTDSDIIDGTTVTSAFRSNILTALAEARALTVVQRPAFVVPAQVAAP